MLCSWFLCIAVCLNCDKKQASFSNTWTNFVVFYHFGSGTSYLLLWRMEGGSQKGELSCFWNNQENGKRETAQVEHFQLFLGHRLTYISMTVRFHCQISDCDTLSVLVTDILVGQCKQHTWTWIGWWLLRSSQYYGVWKEFIKGRCYETEALCIINSIWLEFRKLFKLLSGSGPRFRLALY